MRPARSSTWTSGGIRGRRRIRQAVTPGVEHDDVVAVLDLPGHVRPAQPIVGRTVREDERRLAGARTGAPVVDPDAVREDVTISPPRRRLWSGEGVRGEGDSQYRWRRGSCGTACGSSRIRLKTTPAPGRNASGSGTQRDIGVGETVLPPLTVSVVPTVSTALRATVNILRVWVRSLGLPEHRQLEPSDGRAQVDRDPPTRMVRSGLILVRTRVMFSIRLGARHCELPDDH